jgi:hypothetical protein
MVATPIGSAEVILFSGKQQLKNGGDLLHLQAAGQLLAYAKPVAGENVPTPVADKVRAGDLVAHIEHGGPGELTVCSISYPATSPTQLSPNA